MFQIGTFCGVAPQQYMVLELSTCNKYNKRLYVPEVLAQHMCYWRSPIICTRGLKNIGRSAVRQEGSWSRSPSLSLVAAKAALGVEQRQLLVRSVSYVYCSLARYDANSEARVARQQ